MGNASVTYGTTVGWASQTHLPKSTVIAAAWCPDNNSLRPAYVVCVDQAFGAVVVAIRGTNDVSDMLINAATKPEEFEDGMAHGGFVHATNSLLPYVARAPCPAPMQEKS